MTIAQLNKKAKSLSHRNSVGYIMEYESGELSGEDALVLFAYLIRTGFAWQLQGSIYGRPAKSLIEQGIISPQGKILVIPNPVNELVYNAGRKEGLSGRKLDMYAEYLVTRGFDNDPAYAREWAQRFRWSNAYAYSDKEGQRLINKLEKQYNLEGWQAK